MTRPIGSIIFYKCKKKILEQGLLYHNILLLLLLIIIYVPTYIYIYIISHTRIVGVGTHTENAMPHLGRRFKRNITVYCTLILLYYDKLL